ncbi:hypothetical protein [Devriesea agamarum]|uniref:hypothetical protein n=1 Tax=Devriesea agamarum TaxID=472569 RepID=UPI00071CA13B|nr:hypothetical protein [Devriesea agamarum]
MKNVRTEITPRTIIEAFLPTDGGVTLDLVYDTANAIGMADQPLRLALRRMAAAGEIDVTGRGRQGVLTATNTGLARLGRDRYAVQLALAQDRGMIRWDGCWRLFAPHVPESDRNLRDQLRRELIGFGAANISTSLFISPHNLVEFLAEEQRSVLVVATATNVEVRGTDDPIELAEMLWPAGPLLARYHDLASLLKHNFITAVLGMEAVLHAQLLLAQGLEDALRLDPLLPLELRSENWLPTEVRRSWLSTWNALSRRLPREILYRGWLPIDDPEWE